MHQTKKGKQWYFGMKAHVGVDSKTKIIHTAVATAANVADSAVLPDLLHGEETRVWGDQAYRGQSEVIRECAPQAQDCTHRRYRYKDGVDEVEPGEEPEQVDGALEGGARVCGDEAEVRICEATLSRTEEECHRTVRGVRAGESVLGAEKTVALGTGLARERRLLITGEPPKPAEDRKKPNPSACTGLAEHLLPRRHGLIQSFPSTRAVIVVAFVCCMSAVAIVVFRQSRSKPLTEGAGIEFPAAVSQATKVQLLKDDFRIITNVSVLPTPVLKAFQEKGGSRSLLANPGAKFNPSDVIWDASVPRKRLILAGAVRRWTR